MRRRRNRSIGVTSRHGIAAVRRNRTDCRVEVMLGHPGGTTATPAYAIGQMISDALDPVKAPGKVRTMTDMTPKELAQLVPPRKK